MNDKIIDSGPWQPRVDVELERASLASKCQSFSSLISPWAVQSKTSKAKSPGSTTSASSASSNHEDEIEVPESPFLREFQVAARQLEELTLNVTDDKSVTSDDSFPDNIATMDAVFVGWKACTRSELKADPQRALENTINSISNGLSDSAGLAQENDSRLCISSGEVRIEVKQITKVVPKSGIRVWGVINDKFGIVFKNNTEYECHVFTGDDLDEVTNFCEILNDLSKVNLRKCSSINSLVSDVEKSRSQIDFQAECDYCGSSVIGTDYRADIQQVHRIITELQTKDHQAAYCTISSASMSILPRPGSLFAAGDTLPIDRYFMKCRLRYISFFAVGIDSRYLAIVSVLGPQSVCHVLKILPNALRVSDVLQEQIILRYQKAVEARKIFDRGSAEDKPMMSSIINMLPEEPEPALTPLGVNSRWKSFLSLLKK